MRTEMNNNPASRRFYMDNLDCIWCEGTVNIPTPGKLIKAQKPNTTHGNASCSTCGGGKYITKELYSLLTEPFLTLARETMKQGRKWPQ